MVSKKRRTAIKLKEILPDLKHRELPLIPEDADLGQVITTMMQVSNDCIQYVVDGENRLLGTLSLNDLIRHIFSHSHEPKIHPRRLMDMVTSETAKHIMKKNPDSAVAQDDVEDILTKMVKHNVNQIALVDDENRVIYDITRLDLLREWLERNNRI